MAGKLSGKKVAIIVAHEFEDVELLYPVLRLSEEGAEIVVVPAVRDGNIITGRVPDDLPEFCQEIIKALSE
jgi:putative intracellular protease/amidase